MANAKISDLSALTGASVDAAADVLPIVDTSVTTTKKILVEELGIALNATKAGQEAGTSTKTLVSPAVQQFHPSACKAWALVTFSGGTPSLAASYNVTSLTDGGAGVTTVNFTTAFSSGNYAPVVVITELSTRYAPICDNIATGSVRVVTRDSTTANVDTNFSIVIFGDQ